MAWPARCLAVCAALALGFGWGGPVGCASSGGGGGASGDAGVHGADGVLVHISSGPNDRHALLMGLRMAQMMSRDRDVLVYVDVDGIEAVVEDGPDVSMAPFGSARGMLGDLVSRGVPVYACPGCLEAMGHEPEDLLPGVRVAEKAAFFSFTDGRIVTLDY